MKTKHLFSILLFAALILFSFTSNSFAQQTQGNGQAYLNVQVWDFDHSSVVYPASVWVVDYDGNTVLGPVTNNSQGYAAFSLYDFNSGNYIIHACYPTLPNGTVGGNTYWTYSGPGSDNEEVILDINW
jgi:hypothetical protein